MSRPPNADRRGQNMSRRRIKTIAAVVGVAAVLGVGSRACRPMLAALGALEEIRLPWIALASCLAAGSMLAASELQRRVLRAGGLRMQAAPLLAITFASNAVSATLPVAGSGAGTAFTHQHFKRHGADGALAGWTLAMAGVVSTATLAVLLGIGIAAGGSLTRALVGAGGILVGAVPIVVVLVAPRSPAAALRMQRAVVWTRGRLRRLRRSGDRADDTSIAAALSRFWAFRLGGRGCVRAVLMAVVNWTADALCLAMCVLAAGGSVPWGALAAVYAIAIAASAVSFSPAGIGIVEASISVALVNAGVAGGIALPAAILYRAIICWIPVSIGWLLHARLARQAGT